MGITTSRSPAALPVLGDGRFEVGCADILVAPNSSDDVGVLATVYYPADTAQSFQDDDRPTWLPRSEYVEGLAEYRNASPRRMMFMYKWLIGDTRVAAHWHRPFKRSSTPYQLVIFSHGLSACRHFYSTYCASLASNGYVVAAVEHRDRSACWTYDLRRDANSGEIIEVPVKIITGNDEIALRKRQLHQRVTECVKLFHVLEEINGGCCGSANEQVLLGQDFDWKQLKGQLDMTKVGIIGHSFGAATAIATAAFSTDFSAVISLDGWMLPIEKEILAQVQQPVLFLNAKYFQWEENVRCMLKVGDIAANRNIIITFIEGVHQSFSDFSLLLTGILGRKFGVTGPGDPRRCARAIVELSVEFLRRSFLEANEFDSTLQRYQDIAVSGTNLKEPTGGTSDYSRLLASC